jgi:MEDS: MEthanogen/methylotroph, DcmR Sensory domain
MADYLPARRFAIVTVGVPSLSRWQIHNSDCEDVSRWIRKGAFVEFVSSGSVEKLIAELAVRKDNGATEDDFQIMLCCRPAARDTSPSPYAAFMATARHRCMIYEGSPAKHLPGLARLIGDKIRANQRCLYFNSLPMVAGIRSYLAAAGVDVAQEVNRGSLVLSSEQGHLQDGIFDPARMLDSLADSVNDALAQGYAGLWATGDMTWELGGEKNFDKLMDYECGLEEMFREYPALSGICQYHLDTLPDEALHAAASKHPCVYLNETLSRMNPLYSQDGSPATSSLSALTLKEMIGHLELQAGA